MILALAPCLIDNFVSPEYLRFSKLNSDLKDGFDGENRILIWNFGHGVLFH